MQTAGIMPLRSALIATCLPFWGSVHTTPCCSRYAGEGCQDATWVLRRSWIVSAKSASTLPCILYVHAGALG